MSYKLQVTSYELPVTSYQLYATASLCKRERLQSDPHVITGQLHGHHMGSAWTEVYNHIRLLQLAA